jgi:hypothetical protein
MDLKGETVMTRFGKRTAILAVLALGLSLGGSRARADLTLNVSEAGGPSIAINSTLGTATLTGEAAGTYTFLIDSQLVTFVVPTNGASVNGSFTADNQVANFKANAGGTTTFGDYSAVTIGITQTTNSLGSLLTDINTDVTASNVATAGALTISASNPFGGPSGLVPVTSDLSASTIQSGTVTFKSTVNGTDVPGVPLSLSSHGDTFVTTNLPLSSPFSTSNVLVISGLNAGLTDTINGTTTLGPAVVPEPASLAIVFSALPMLGFAAWRRRRTRPV